MIIGHLNALPLAGLPAALRDILALPQCSLAALQANAMTGAGSQNRLRLVLPYWSGADPAAGADRHTEYHRLWADIQVVLAGEEHIYAGTHSIWQAGER